MSTPIDIDEALDFEASAIVACETATELALRVARARLRGAAAGIGAAANKALAMQLATGFKGGITLGGGLAIASAAIAIEQAGELAINNILGEKAKRMSDAVAGDTALTNETTALLEKARGGKLSKEDIAHAREVLAAGQNNIAAQQRDADPEKKGAGEKLLGGVTRLFGGQDAREAMDADERAKRETLERTMKTFEQLNRAIETSAKALRAHGDAAGKANPNDPSRNVPISSPARGGDH